jgi:hypothetical protein
MTDLNTSCWHQPRLRLIVAKWKQHVKNQKRFFETLTKVMTKSCFGHAFGAIQQKAKSVLIWTVRERHTIGMVRIYFKSMMSSCLSKWRTENLYSVQQLRIQTDLLYEAELHHGSTSQEAYQSH